MICLLEEFLVVILILGFIFSELLIVLYVFNFLWRKIEEIFLKFQNLLDVRRWGLCIQMTILIIRVFFRILTFFLEKLKFFQDFFAWPRQNRKWNSHNFKLLFLDGWLNFPVGFLIYDLLGEFGWNILPKYSIVTISFQEISPSFVDRRDKWLGSLVKPRESQNVIFSVVLQFSILNEISYS